MTVLIALTALAPLSIDIYTPSLPRLESDLGGGHALAEATVTACLLGIGIGQLCWGPLSDRTGRRPVVLAGVIGWTVAGVVSAVSTTAVMLVAARALAGIAGAAGIVVARSIVRDLSVHTAEVAARIGILSMVTALAPVIAPVAGTGIAQVWGWRGDFVGLAGLGALLAILFGVIVPESLPPERRIAGDGRPIRTGFATALADPEIRGVAGTLALHSFGFYAYIAGAAFIVEGQFHQSATVFAVVFGSNALAMFGANLIFRRLVRRSHPSVLLGAGITGSVLAGCALLVTGWVGAPSGTVWAASTVFAASVGLVLPAAHSWGQVTTVPSGAASAATGSAQFLGGVLGSPVTGLVGVTAGHLGAVVLAGSAAALLSWHTARRARSRKLRLTPS